MLDLDANPRLRFLFIVARSRVSVGFLAAAVAFWLARPTWNSLGYGAAIATGGEVLRVWAAGHVRKGQEVTHSGPYRFIRHPLYCGSFLIGLGFAVAASDLFVACLVIGYLAVTLVIAGLLEEATLRDAFREEFEIYVKGEVQLSFRRFSLAQMVANGEPKAALGFVSALGVLGLKVWWLSQ